jgi:hypothetical protein
MLLLVAFLSALNAAHAVTVDELRAQNRIQEAAWLLQESGRDSEASELTAQLRQWMETAPVSDRQSLRNHNISDVRIMNLDVPGLSGPQIRVVCKPDDGYDDEDNWRLQHYKREIAAYVVDELLQFNVAPLTIYRRSGCDGALKFFIASAQTGEDAGVHRGSRSDRLKLFDTIVGDIDDAHSRNFLVIADMDSRHVGIDYNLAFFSTNRAIYRTMERPDLRFVDDSLLYRIRRFDCDRLWEPLRELLPRDQIRRLCERIRAI